MIENLCKTKGQRAMGNQKYIKIATYDYGLIGLGDNYSLLAYKAMFRC